MIRSKELPPASTLSINQSIKTTGHSPQQPPPPQAMVRAHTESEKKALPPPLSMLGIGTAAQAINLHKYVIVGVSGRRAGWYLIDGWINRLVWIGIEVSVCV